MAFFDPARKEEFEFISGTRMRGLARWALNLLPTSVANLLLTSVANLLLTSVANLLLTSVANL